MGGAAEALAGGGSFITLPSLMLTGMDARAANITSTVALFPAQLVTGFTGRADAGTPTGLRCEGYSSSASSAGRLARSSSSRRRRRFSPVSCRGWCCSRRRCSLGQFFSQTFAGRRSAFVASRRERRAVFDCRLRRLFRRRHRPLDDGRADHDGFGGAQRWRVEEHSRWRDQRLRGCDLRLFQGRALAAGSPRSAPRSADGPAR